MLKRIAVQAILSMLTSDIIMVQGALGLSPASDHSKQERQYRASCRRDLRIAQSTVNTLNANRKLSRRQRDYVADLVSSVVTSL